MSSSMAMTDLWRWVDEARTDPLSEFTVAQLGQLRTTVLAALAQVEEELHRGMRLMREEGATQVDIMAASQYRSIDAVRKILDPVVKDKAATARKRRRGDVVVAPVRVVVTGDATEAAITGSGWAQGG